MCTNGLLIEASPARTVASKSAVLVVVRVLACVSVCEFWVLYYTVGRSCLSSFHSIQFKVNYVLGRSYFSFISNDAVVLTWCLDEKYLTIHNLVSNNCVKYIGFLVQTWFEHSEYFNHHHFMIFDVVLPCDISGRARAVHQSYAR